MIDFNKPYLTGKEAHYMYQAVYSGKISGNGVFTQKCQNYFQERYGFRKCLLTTSCTDALEMCAILCNIQEGDEVIVPSYTFVSSALAFVRQGAKIIFADSMKDHPNIDVQLIESLVTSRTKVIVVVHYAGIACDMDRIMDIANRHGLLVIEDAAQAINSFYKDRALGSIGHLAAFSFHETKNITSGEGGMLVVNDSRFVRRAEIIWEKGTNRVEFFRGEVNKYGWIDVGSSFLPSEIVSGFLWAQIESLDSIQARRNELWNEYHVLLKPLADKGLLKTPVIPDYATNNAHMFYLVCNSLHERTGLILKLKKHGFLALYHYLSLHKSPYYFDKHDGRSLPMSEMYSEQLVRLPMFYELTSENISDMVTIIKKFFTNYENDFKILRNIKSEQLRKISRLSQETEAY